MQILLRINRIDELCKSIFDLAEEGYLQAFSVARFFNEAEEASAKAFEDESELFRVIKVEMEYIIGETSLPPRQKEFNDRLRLFSKRCSASKKNRKSTFHAFCLQQDALRRILDKRSVLIKEFLYHYSDLGLSKDTIAYLLDDDLKKSQE